MSREAFLDGVGAGVAPMHPRPAWGAGGIRVLIGALLPILVTLAALGGVAALGISRRMALPETVEPYAYGFFLDRYPLFAFALIYGVARIVTVALGDGPGGTVRRLLFGGAGAVLLVVAGLYPTFGGLILRGAFATGGMAFLTGQPLWLAYTLGAAVAAAMFGGIIGLSGLAANRSLRPRWRRIGGGALSFLCLWFGAVVIGSAHSVGFGPWPARAMMPGEFGLAAGLLLLAAVPHAAVVALRASRPVA